MKLYRNTQLKAFLLILISDRYGKTALSFRSDTAMYQNSPELVPMGEKMDFQVLLFSFRKKGFKQHCEQIKSIINP